MSKSSKRAQKRDPWKPSVDYIFRGRIIHILMVEGGQWVLRRESGFEMAAYPTRAKAVRAAEYFSDKEGCGIVIHRRGE